MQRLKDVYYTGQILDGNVNQDGYPQSSPSYIQGEDIVLSFYLVYNDQPVTNDDFIIEVFVKKSPAASNILWKAVMGSGLYEVPNSSNGYYKIIMPAGISALFLPGLYHMEVKITQKIGKGEDKDLSLVILSDAFNIELGASSPNPKLRATRKEEITYDPETGITTTTITSTEPTLPIGINVI